MKKTVVFISVVCMLICSLFAVNASENTPWDTEGVKVHIYQDFSSFGNMNIMQFTEGFNLESAGMTHFMRIKNNRLDFYAGGGGDMYFNWTLPISDQSKAQFANADGIGFYVENNTPGDIIIGLQSKNSDNVQYICSGYTYCFDLETGDFYTGDTDDTWDVHCMPIVPAYFKGYIIFPIESVTTRNGDAWSSSDYLDSLGLILRGGVLNEKTNENMVIDNLFVYGKNVVDNNNGRVVFNAGEVPADDVTTPTATPTTAPTATPDVTPTTAPTDEQTAGNTTKAPEQSTLPEQSNAVETTTEAVAGPTEDSASEPAQSQQPQGGNDNGNDLLWVYIMMAVVVIAGVVVIVIVLTKKN